MNAPRLRTVSTLRSPFGFVRTSELPTEHHKEFLTFTIPSDEMRMSEARAWADAQALQWAKVNRTVIVGDIVWRVTEDTICSLVRTTIAPRARGTARPINPQPRTDRRNPAPHPGCSTCEQVAAYADDVTTRAIADELNLNPSTVTRHRVRSAR